MTRLRAYGKVNLALVVGERRGDGLHEVATVVQPIDLADELELEETDGPNLAVAGFPEDTLVRSALGKLAAAARVEPRWRVAIDKRIPVAAGLGGGSADAAAALLAVNELLAESLSRERLAEIAASVGADVPALLERGPVLAEGAGERVTPLELPSVYWLLVALPRGAAKASSGDVYRRFDEQGGGPAFEERRDALLARLARCSAPRDLAALPPNDLAGAAGAPTGHLDALREAGAFRADVSGAGPAVYGLFETREAAAGAGDLLPPTGGVWVARPVW